MRPTARILLLTLVACLWAVLPLRADTLELRDGKLLHGKYLGGTSQTVRFEVSGEIKVFPVHQVLAITFESTGAAANKTSVPASSESSPLAPAPTLTTRPQATRAAATESEWVTVPAGTVFTVRMIDSVDSETNRIGDIFRANLDEDLLVGDRVAARRGTEVRGRLAEAKSAGRIAGKSELQLELTEILIDNRPYPLLTGEYEVSGKSRGGQTATRVGAGAAVGAVIGAIAGGGKGAAIGAATGAGAGTAIQVLTKGEQVHVPSETLLDFRLMNPASLPARQSTSRQAE